jgi:hypothetical protein
LLENCHIGPNFQKVPVKGNMAFLVFVQRNLTKLKSKTSKQKLLQIKATKIVDIVKHQFKNNEKVTYGSIGNNSGLADCLVYGVLINKKGVAVNGFSSCCPKLEDNLSQNIYLRNIKINNIVAAPEEVISISNNDKPLVMGFGAIVRLKDIIDIKTGSRKRNDFNDVVFSLAKLLIDSDLAKSFSPTSLYKHPWLVSWYFSKNPENLFKLIQRHQFRIYCNADTMNHVHKGPVGLRLDGINGAMIDDTKIANVQNHGDYGSNIIGDYSKSHPLALLEGYGGNICRGISTSGCSDIVLQNINVQRILSKTGCAYGCDYIGGKNGVYTENIDISQIITLSNEIRAGNRWPESRCFTNV